MGMEIELKYLVKEMPKLPENIEREKIVQAYLQRSNGTGKTIIRVRQLGNKGFLTIKGEKVGLSQPEYEYEIPVEEAKSLFALCEPDLQRSNGTGKATVRVRQLGNKGFLTIKGEKVGLSQPEYEYEIPVEEAKSLFALCEPGILNKTRYYIPHGEHTIELDVFEGKNAGLILAEIELMSEEDKVEIPSWFDKDVSHDSNYSNAALSRL